MGYHRVDFALQKRSFEDKNITWLIIRVLLDASVSIPKLSFSLVIRLALGGQPQMETQSSDRVNYLL